MRLALSLSVAVLGLWGLTAEVRRSLPSSASALGISVLWSVYGTAVVVLGMVRTYAPLRKLGLAVFGLAVLKVFLYDLSTIGGPWRILSFVTLGAFLVGVSWLYHRYGEEIRAFISSGDASLPPSPDAPGIRQSPVEKADER